MTAYWSRNICKHCGRKIVRNVKGLWLDDKESLSQYCWVDPVQGSQLHEPSLEVNKCSD